MMRVSNSKLSRKSLTRADVKKLTTPALKEPESTKKSNDNLLASDENSSIGNLLTTAYGVIKLILEQLDWPDLINASQVSPEWNQVANVIYTERQTPTWFHLIPNNKTGHSLHFHRYAQYSKPALCLLFLNDLAGVPLPCKLMPEEACVQGCEDKHRLLQLIEKIYKKSNCDIIAICATAAKSSFTESIMVIRPKKLVLIPTLVGIAIPEINGVHINKFYVNKKSIDKFKLNKIISDDHHLRCLFTFCTFKGTLITDETVVLERLMEVIHKHQNNVPFAYGGGVVTGMKDSDFDQHFNLMPSDHNVLCITFSSQKDEHVDFNAYSVIIWENAQEMEDVDIIIGNLSKKAIRREHMAAFRFACVSRNNMSGIELDSFQKYFPDVHMIGFEGFGEMGLYSVPNDNDSSPESKRGCTDRNFTHSNTSIIILLTWGKIKTS